MTNKEDPLKAYKYVIIKVTHNKKVVKLLIQRRKYPYNTYMEWKEQDPQPLITHRNPTWIKEFLERLNNREIKFL